MAYHTIPWVCYRRRNQWLRLALDVFCLPLIWLARVVYLLVGLPLIWLARVVYLSYVEATVFGVPYHTRREPCTDIGGYRFEDSLIL